MSLLVPLVKVCVVKVERGL
ncbi:hypothetical protein Tco_0476430, partial [Tanacetum coccineum]